jgi:HEAT repeat protein
MERGLRDPAAIPSLGRIFLAGDIEARVAAAAALRNTGSPDAIPFLAKGLTDPVLDVRFWAVAGLAEITGDKGRSTTRKDFDSAGQQYVTYWTAWARSRGLIKRP